MHSTPSKTHSAIVAYVPALHAGYISFFKKHPGTRIFVLGKSFIDAYPRLNRDLRALDPAEIVVALTALHLDARAIEIDDTQTTLAEFDDITLPDEDVS